MSGIFKYKKLIGAALTIIALLVGVGVFFAMEKGEPEYMSKIDKIMFDTKNKSPKYVITLPAKSQKIIEQIKAPKKVEQPTPGRRKRLDVKEVFDNIPTLAKITPVANKIPLKYTSNISSLVEEVEGKEIPKVSYNGRQPWIEYGKQVEVMPNFFKVAIIIRNMGMDLSLTELLVKGASTNVSISFSPYGRNLTEDIKKAREYGHETYVDLLLPSLDFLRKDTGPLAMSITASDEENISRLYKTLGIGAPVGGVIISNGSIGEDNIEQIEKILHILKDRGLLVIDATKGNQLDEIKVPGLARRKADIVIDEHYNREHIARQIMHAEAIARQNGNVTIVIEAKPLLLSMMRDWVEKFSPQISYEEAKKQGVDINNLEMPFALVPASAVVIE